MNVTLASHDCVQANTIKGIPLYAHVSDLAGTKKPYVLPVPFMNVLNGALLCSLNPLLTTLKPSAKDMTLLMRFIGGSHAGGRLAFQEFMIVSDLKSIGATCTDTKLS